ncbi:MAG TPA: hypothetical protein VMR37_00075 [Rhabdochlamydiaceae bacterium]|nr:hypothetical protein [Rhabdochlamydiaceae bacterium]
MRFIERRAVDPALKGWVCPREKIKREMLRILPIFLFFLVSFTFINWVEAYLFEGIGVTPFRFLEVTIAAALIAKISLVVDHTRLIKLFRKKPLAYDILWKITVYWIILLIVRLLIRFVPFLFGPDHNFMDDFMSFRTHMNWHLFISLQAYYLMLLFIFVTLQELTFKIGTKKMRRLFFGK